MDRCTVLSATLLLSFLLSPSVWSDALTLQARPSQSVLRADVPQSIFIKISLTGAKLESQDRAAVNIGLVLDKSTSMKNSFKLARAKQAAITAIRRLGSQDTISIVAFNDSVELVQPATQLTETNEITHSIQQIRPSGKAALFAGISKGAKEVRKFLSQNQINRVILLSDGQASIGPRASSELGALGDVLRKEGISITTIGLGGGYNEDLMQKLALQSGGNHAYAETADDLAKIFENEFSDVLSVVAREILIQVRCLPGVRPVRVYGHNTVVNGNTVEVSMSHVYSKQEKYVIVELEIPPTASGHELNLAHVSAQYTNVQTKLKETLSSSIKVQFSQSVDAINASINKDVMISTVYYLCAREYLRAIHFIDKKNPTQVEQVLTDDANFIRANAIRYQAKALVKLANQVLALARSVQQNDQNRLRKKLRYDFHRLITQQRW